MISASVRSRFVAQSLYVEIGGVCKIRTMINCLTAAVIHQDYLPPELDRKCQRDTKVYLKIMAVLDKESDDHRSGLDQSYGDHECLRRFHGQTSQ